jgi:1,4-dihydroxy-2-naphthoate octaprenyltransferase
MSWHTFRLFVRLSRPLALLGGALTFSLGAGIARYLGITLDWRLYFLGQAWVTTLQLSTHYFSEYFAPSPAPGGEESSPFPWRSGALDGEDALPRETALWAGVAALAAVTSFIAMLRVAGAPPAALVVMLLIFAAGLFYAVPPMRLAETGYGELIISIVAAGLIPALAFTLQSGEIHRLVAMSTFPLILLYLAMLIAFGFPAYASDLKRERRTLLTRLGWQRAMAFHNLLILTAYVLLALAMFFNFPPSVGLPAFLSLPLGLFQIWYMTRIAAGAKPNWGLLGWMAIAVFGVTTYLLAFSFWTK